MKIDLHLHTNASDGQYTPDEIVKMARERRLDVIAITDHDTTAGVKIALQSAKAGVYHTPLIVPGIELSAEDIAPDGRAIDVHMLGYWMDLDNLQFQQALDEFRIERERRGILIVERLHDLDMPLKWDRVMAFAGGAIGRPHIARAMVEAGYADSVRQAFDLYLHNGGSAYVARHRLSPEESIAMIHRAGGVAVLAHPALVPDYKTVIARLVPAGLDGLEVVHPRNPYDLRQNLRGLAAIHDLVLTGGSDFHGKTVNDNVMGSVTPPENCHLALQARAERY